MALGLKASSCDPLWGHTTGCILSKGHSVAVTLNTILAIIKALKLFSIRIKELFEPIVLRKKATGFCSFKSILMRNRS